jgi:hypothetical protein
MMIYNFLKVALFLMMTSGLMAPFSFAGSRLPCAVRNSNYCKNPKYFKQDKKDGCAGPRTNCRQKFCRANCFSPSSPLKSDDPQSIYKLCQTNCDPQEMTSLSRQERALFQERFEDKTVKRKHELNQYIDSLLSRLPWCEGECDYDETNPGSCSSKHAKLEDHWAVCAKNCHFLKDIKEHADYCVNQQQMQIKPDRPKPAPRGRRGVIIHPTGEVSFPRF